MLRFLTAGESHGPAVVMTIEGLPAGLRLDLARIDAELKRRQGGYGRGGRMRIEQDSAEVLAGLRGGVTLGSPITLVVRNRDNKLEQLGPVHKVRPGHADLAGALKYGTTDARDVLERASARETVGRVLAGAVCAQLLEACGIALFGHVLRVGSVAAGHDPELHLGPPEGQSQSEWLAGLRQRRDASQFYSLDPDAEAGMKGVVDDARRAGDTVGGLIEVLAYGVPPGLGSHVQWDRKLDGLIAQACLSVQAIKSVEIGAGREVAELPGSQVHDPILPGHGRNPNMPTALHRPSNRAGGIEGGTSNGMPVVVRCAMKPIATLMRPLATVDLSTGEVADAAIERSDICAVPAASVVLEHAVAVPLAGELLRKYGGDSLGELLGRISTEGAEENGINGMGGQQGE